MPAGIEGEAVTEPVTRLRLVESTAMRIESCLRAMSACIGDEAIPADVRKELAATHAVLHRCRSAATVAQMERAQGIGPGGDAA